MLVRETGNRNPLFRIMLTGAEMLAYPITLTPGENGLVLFTFPDLPEAVSCARGEDEAIARAGDVLDIILASYRAEGRPIPRPSDIEGAPVIRSERFGRA
jgi:antitoxin HicB